MRKLMLLVLFFTGLVNAQDKEFKFTKDGFTDFVVTDVEGKSQQELYKKALDWIQVAYKNPKEVIKAQIENDYVRIEGFKANMLCTKLLGISNCEDVRYQIEISFKDGKYKFDVIKVESYQKGTKYNNFSSGWRDFPISGDIGNTYFKKDGTQKSIFKSYPESFETTFNDLNSSLKEFLTSESIPSKTKEW